MTDTSDLDVGRRLYPQPFGFRCGRMSLRDKVLFHTSTIADDKSAGSLASPIRAYNAQASPAAGSSKRRTRDKAIVETEFANSAISSIDWPTPNRITKLIDNLSAEASHSGNWLHTLPVIVCRSHLDKSSVVGIAVGGSIFAPASAKLIRVDSRGPEGLILAPHLLERCRRGHFDHLGHSCRRVPTRQSLLLKPQPQKSRKIQDADIKSLVLSSDS